MAVFSFQWRTRAVVHTRSPRCSIDGPHPAAKCAALAAEPTDMAIEPALTAEEWAERGDPVVDGYIDWESGVVDVRSSYDSRREGRFIPALIALANAALPDNDPRKITRAMIRALRNTVTNLSLVDPDGEAVDAFATALETYLPPA